MNSSDHTSTQSTRGIAKRIEVCPLCREPVDRGEASAPISECPVCRFHFGVDAGGEPESREVVQPIPAPAEAMLDKWLSGAPLIPERRSAWKQIRRWARRNRPAAAGLGVLAAAIVLSAAHLYGTSRTLEESLRRTTIERDEALARCEQLQSEAAEFARNVDEHVDQSFRASERNLRISIAGEVAAEATDLAKSQPEHGLAMATVALRMAHRENAPPIGPALELVYGLSTRPVDQAGENLGRVDVLAISPDGTRLAAADAEGRLRLFDLVGDAEPISLPGKLNHAATLEFSPDGLRLVARAADSTVNIWRLEGVELEKQMRTVLKVPESRLAGAVQSDDNRWIVAGCNGFRPGDTTVRLWDIASRNPNTNYFDLPGNRGRIQSVAVSRSGQWVAVGNHGGMVALWSTAVHPLRGVTKMLEAGKHGVNTLAFTPDGRKLVTSEGTDGGECLIRVWDLTAGDAAPPMMLEGHVAPVRKLAISTNGRCVASADDTGRVSLWNLDVPAAEARVATFEAHVDAVTALEFGIDGRRLYTAGLDGQVRVWDMTRMPIEKPLAQLKAGESAVTGLVVSRDGRKVAAVTADQGARLWRLEADDLLRWAYDGSRRPAASPGAKPSRAETLVETTPATRAPRELPPVLERPIAETAERSDANPLR